MKHIKKINEGWFKNMLNGGQNSGRIREKINNDLSLFNTQ